MITSKYFNAALYTGLISVFIGLTAFSISWNSWEYFEGPLPGYEILLFPGNLTLIYFWHPIFTEEVNFWPKLCMLLFGQFFVVTSFVAIITFLKKLLDTNINNKVLKSDK